MFSKEDFIAKAGKLTENAMKFYPFYKGKVQTALKFTGKNTRIVQGEKIMNRKEGKKICLLPMILLKQRTKIRRFWNVNL